MCLVSKYNFSNDCYHRPVQSSSQTILVDFKCVRSNTLSHSPSDRSLVSMPSSMLVEHRHILRMHFIMGVCPSVLQRTSTNCAVLVGTKCGYLYTVCLFVFMAGSLGFLYVQNFVADGFLRNFDDSKSIILFLEFFVLAICFTLTFLAAIVNSPAHRSLLNRIAATAQYLHELRSEHDQLLCVLGRRFARRCMAELAATVAVYAVVNVLGWMLFEAPDSKLYTKLQYFAAALSMTTVAVGVLHVRHIALMIVALFERLTKHAERRMLVSDAAPADNDLEEFLQLAKVLFGLRSDVGRVFGTLLWLNEMKDFVLMTTALYFLISATLYVHFVFTWRMLLFAALYLMPNLLKNAILSRTMEELGVQTERVQRVAKRVRCGEVRWQRETVGQNRGNDGIDVVIIDRFMIATADRFVSAAPEARRTASVHYSGRNVSGEFGTHVSGRQYSLMFAAVC